MVGFDCQSVAGQLLENSLVFASICLNTDWQGLGRLTTLGWPTWELELSEYKVLIISKLLEIKT